MTDYPDDPDADPEASLLFWLVIGVVIFAVTGFCAGLLYPYFPESTT